MPCGITPEGGIGMSFRNRLGIAFATVVAIMASILLVVWWSLETALTRQAAIASFSLDVYTALYDIEHQQHLFISTQKIQHAVATTALLEGLASRLAEAGQRFAGRGGAGNGGPAIGLDEYEEKFHRFSVDTVALETLKSRLGLEGTRLLAASGELPRGAGDGGQAFFHEVGRLLQAEKDFLLSQDGDKADMVASGAAALERQVTDAMQHEVDEARRLRLFRIARAAATYRQVFADYLRQRQQFTKGYEHLFSKGRQLTEQLHDFVDRENQVVAADIVALRNRAVLASLVALLLAIAAALFLAARITRPIAQLRHSAEEIVAGNLDTTVAISSADEIGALGRIFNEMTARLRDSFADILRYRDHLEEEVARRTTDLLREIEQRREAEQLLRVNEERLRMIIEQSPLGVIVWDNDLRVVRWNRMAERIFLYSAAEAFGMSAEALLPEERRGDFAEIRRTLLATPQGVRSSTRNLRKDGEAIPCDWVDTPISDGSGRVVGALSLVQDARERLRAEEEAIKQKKLESTGVLAGGIAHDFNNILTAILGSLNLALHDPALAASSRGLLAAAEKASLRARDLTQQLLTFAKGGEPIRQSTSLAELIEDSAGFVLSGSKVSCRVEIPGQLWPAHVDRGQISQVIQNIVLNARHAMPEGGAVTIHCSNVAAGSEEGAVLDPGRRYVRIAIRDNGIGIPRHLLERIFDPYFTTKQEGSGLGLAITLSIVNKHHGHILVDSTPGQGTEFVVYLPAADEPAATEAPVDSQQALPSLRVLVMDDEKMVREVVSAMLRSLGHQAVAAVNGREAVALAEQGRREGLPVDMAIVDLTIPGGMGGREALPLLRQVDPGLPVIVASGYSTDPVMASYRQHGFNATVAKPFVLAQLKEALANALAEAGRSGKGGEESGGGGGKLSGVPPAS